MNLDSRIYIAGHRGLVGSAIHRELTRLGYTNILTRTREELDLLNTNAVNDFFAKEKPGYVFLAAAKVGGILANNTYPADFIRDNLIIQTNVIEASRINNIDRLLFLGSSCIYPKLAPQPMPEPSLLTGPLEPTNRPYALAKIAGIEMCWSYNRQHKTKYLAAMPTNLYGPGDNFDLNTSHVLPALIRKTAEAIHANAPKVTVWGTGAPRRELLYSDDLAQACVFLMNLDEARYSTLLSATDPPLINIGTPRLAPHHHPRTGNPPNLGPRPQHFEQLSIEIGQLTRGPVLPAIPLPLPRFSPPDPKVVLTPVAALPKIAAVAADIPHREQAIRGSILHEQLRQAKLQYF